MLAMREGMPGCERGQGRSQVQLGNEAKQGANS